MKKCFYLLVSLLFVGCVDKTIDLTEVEGNIGINADNLVVPLGYITDMTLGDILSEQLGEVQVDPQTGDFSLSYGLDEQTITINGADATFSIPASVFNVGVEYPAFKLADSKMVLNQECIVGGKINGIELTMGYAIDISKGVEFKVSGQQDGQAGYSLDVVVPEYVERIDRIYMAHDSNLPGAPLVAKFDLGSLGSINGGGVVNVTLDIPADFEVYDSNFNLVKNNRVSLENYRFKQGESIIEFVIYIASITNSSSATDGEIHLPGELKYHISYEMSTQSGQLVIDELPTLTLAAELICEDAEIVLGQMDLMPQSTFENKFTVDSFNDGIKSIKNIAFENTTIDLFVNGMDWWDADAISAGTLNDIFVELALPKSFVFQPLTNDLKFNKETNTIRVTLAQLRNGVSIALQGIDFGAAGATPGADGKTSIDMSIGLRVALEQGARIRLKYMQHDGDVAISAGYNKTNLTVASVTGCVDFKYEEALEIDLGGLLGDMPLEINGLGVSPVIDFTLTNPLILPLYVNASLIPIVGGAEVEDGKVVIERFEIGQATVGSSLKDVVAKSTHIRIGSNLQPEEGVTIVNTNLKKLFDGALPERLKVALSVATDATTDVTLAVVPSYKISYGYNFFMPIAFGESLDLSYSGTAEGLFDSIGDLTSMLSAVGTVTLICEVENSTPLNLEIDFTLLDKSGNPSSIEIVRGGDGAIKGSADGVTPCKSDVTLQLRSKNNGDIFAELSSVAALQYQLRATSAADGVALNSNQAISANLLMEVDGNLGVNLKNLMNE